MRVLTGDVWVAEYLIVRGGARLADLLVDRPRASAVFALEADSDLLALQEDFSRGGPDVVAPVKELRDAITQLRATLARALRQPTPQRPSRTCSANL